MSEFGESGDLAGQFNLIVSTKTGSDSQPKQIASAEVGGIHLNIAPVEGGGGYNVYFLGDKDGRGDFGQVLNSSFVEGASGDLEEIALTFAQRLASGVEPENMFVDIEEKNSRIFHEILEKMKKDGIKPKNP